MSYSQKVIDKFWSQVDKTDYCWNWTGTIKGRNTLVFGIGDRKSPDKNFNARHFSLLLIGKQIPKYKKVLPLECNNNLCINPSHLVSGDELFYRKVQKLSEAHGGCWVWIGAQDKQGYGVFTPSYGGHKKAHRHSWELSTGIKLSSSRVQVCHTCDHPYCVNPDHLFLGTHQDNIDDKLSKDRGGYKLTIAQVKEIKILLLLGEKSQADIARIYFVHPSIISNIKRGKIWCHISD